MEEIIKIKKAPKVEDTIEKNKIYPYYVQDFIEKMKDRDLSKFYHNLKEATFTPITKEQRTIKYAGAEYNIYTNEIEYIKERLKKGIMHELTHMFTRCKDEDRIYVGFMQVRKDGYGIGVGLNEGYTCIFDERYFMDYDSHKIDEINRIYPTTKYITLILDYLIGKDQMEEYFENADLYGLAKELSIYSSPKKTYNFITRLDKLHFEADTKKIPNIRKVFELYNRIIMYYSECFTTKFKIMLDNGELSPEDYHQSLKFVQHIMSQQLTYFKVIKSRKLIKDYNKLLLHVNSKSK